MAALEDALCALAQGIRTGNAKELAHRRAALEADLEPMVRCALRTGTGLPGLVSWVRGALPSVTGGNVGGPAAERAAPVLARLLCRALINQHRDPRHEMASAVRPTLVGR
jgi:hypothetical protein